MNLLLLDPEEVAADGAAKLDGRRAKHVYDVLHAAPGTLLRAGIVDGPLGSAEVLQAERDRLWVRFAAEREPAPAADVLLLAVPRPKVLLRILEHAAALGFGRILLCRTWRVDKSWLDSSAMDPAAQREHLRLGLEQAGRTQLPKVQFFPLFKPFVEDDLPQLGLPRQRFVAHPTAATPTAGLPPLTAAPLLLAIGPDGGFLPYEVERLAGFGCAPITCGPHALRTETAVALLFGQLDLLRALARRNP